MSPFYRAVFVWVVVVLSLPICSSVESSDFPIRRWFDNTGAYSTNARYVGYSDGKIRLLNAEDKMIHVPVNRLSLRDRTYVANIQAARTAASSTSSRGNASDRIGFRPN